MLLADDNHKPRKGNIAVHTKVCTKDFFFVHHKMAIALGVE